MKLLDKPYVRITRMGKEIVFPISMDTDTEIVETWQDMEDIDIEVKKHRSQRSKDANAYYFSLLRKIADKQGITLAEVHNMSLAETGYAWLDKNGKKTWVLRPDNDEWKSDMELHYAPTDRTLSGKDGITYRYYYLLLPSHLMDTKQMSVLIDNAIQDCRNLGVYVENEQYIKD